MLVPLAARGRTLGVITLVRGDAGPATAESDLPVAQDLAARCALAIENARFFGAQHAAGQRLQMLFRRPVEVQEDERRRLARELHDELGQSLTGLKLLLEMARRGDGRGVAAGADSPGTPSAAIAEPLTEAQALVGTLLAQVRTLSVELRPAILDDLGVLPALLWHLERYTQQTAGTAGVNVAREPHGQSRAHR
jgi:signal transduction histidine kinase